MDHNNSIGCNVNECKHHAQAIDYCTLEKINVTKHSPQASTAKCTDCESFECKH